MATLAYLMNPAVISNSTLWGQIDGLTALFSLLSIYLFPSHLFLSAFSLGFGTLIKIQAIVALPVIFYLSLNSFRKFATFLFIFSATFLIAFIPFWNTGSLANFVIDRILVTLNQYPYGSVNAFNYWGLFGFWQSEGSGLFSANKIGMLAAMSVSLIALLRSFKTKDMEYPLLAIFFLANFFFFTRMHERHLLPALAPLVIASAVFRPLWVSYVFLSITYLANMAYSFYWIQNDFAELFSKPVINALILLNLATFALTLYVVLTNKRKPLVIPHLMRDLYKSIKPKIKKPRLLKDRLSSKMARSLLFAITVFALTTRLLWLDQPKNEYFDEIYHAFTARIAFHGDPKAWEWWNPHPEGFAYEWTHPPVAKIIMMGGMAVLGENSLGWRLPAAIFSTATIPLIYIIAYELFKSRDIGILSAATYALDGLPLSMGRIGMNDTYFVFFALLALYFFLKQKYFPSSLFWGLSLASKWSALWLLPILGIIFISNNKSAIQKFQFKKKFLGLLWFAIIPPAVYLASYLPMFLTNHGLDIFWGVQKQMWWYHTRLKAEHPFTSPWWSWPILMRPIWLYASSPKAGIVQNIYAMGNPLVFWFGLASIFISGVYSFVENNKKLGIVVFAYVAFFIPWALSPRIMFLYHYLPSIPFLAIATGYVLKRNEKLIIPFLTGSLILFIYFYPRLVGLGVPESLNNSYFWFTAWR